MGSQGNDYKFQGWMGLDPKAVKGNMKWQSYEPKKWEETDVDIKVTHCGICGSDLHTLRSGWMPTIYPCCVGHEVVGIIVRAGSKVKGGLKIGDRAGVGAQSASCFKPDCEDCMNGQENHCAKMVGTYSSKYPDGSKSYGGYADYWRGPSHFVIKIPDSIPSEEAAPMLCGGITAFSPLKHNGAGPGKRVGIVGIGGLGHFGLLYAKALGCDRVVAISRTSVKKADATEMGADDFIATNEDKEWAQYHARSLDLIVSTVSDSNMPLDSYLQLLRSNGTFIQVGAPEDKMPAFSAFALIAKGVRIGGSIIGSPGEIKEMLELTVKKNVHPWIQKRPLRDANKAVVDMENGKARYRYVLVNESHANLRSEGIAQFERRMAPSSALLEGKVAAVTGGLTGIGRAIAIGFLEHGCKVAINYLGGAADNELLHEMESQLRPYEATFKYVAGDISRPETGKALVHVTVKEWGRLDIFVSNAGICQFAEFLEIEPDLYSRTVRTNLDGSFYAVQAAARQMASQDPPGGSIIGVSSISALVGGGLQTHYTPTKAGILSLMQSCAVALGKYNIRCNALLPGTIKTQLNEEDLNNEDKRKYMEGRIPLGRIGVPEDMVGPVVFLAGDLSRYVTGAQLLVDGGLFVNLQ